DPADDLKYHRLLAEDETFNVKVSPSFRPDKALAIDADDYGEWLGKLESSAGMKVDGYRKFLEALDARLEHFDAHGCRASDHGINEMFYEETSFDEAAEIFDKVLGGGSVSAGEVAQFKTYTLVHLAKRYHAYGWAMQLHIGPLRNNNSRMFERTGADSGFDSINDGLVAKPLSRFFDAVDKTDEL